MPFEVPTEIHRILENVDAGLLPLAEFELGEQLSIILKSGELSLAQRSGACAEWAAFSFLPLTDDESGPWKTHYGPIHASSDTQGRTIYIPDLAQIDADTITHWERRAMDAKHPILRARYADLVWDLKSRAIQKRANIKFARVAVDAYLDAVGMKLYKHPVSAVLSVARALKLALIAKDTDRISASKRTIIATFEAVTESRDVVIWSQAIDQVLRNKKMNVTPDELARFVRGLERTLDICTTPGGGQFDPWAAKAAAGVLASHYDRARKKNEVHRVIREYGKAFEYIAADASPLLAMGWTQPIFDEYRSRGMADDANRVLQAYSEKGKLAAGELKKIRSRFEIPAAEFEQFLDRISQGTLRDCLTNVAVQFIPRAGKNRNLLEEMLSRTPLLAGIEVTRIVDGHFAAHAGSIETDPDGRLVMQLAQYIDIEDLFLIRALQRIREKHLPDAAAILSVLHESPIFDPERRALLETGVSAYLAEDHIKAIHVLIPQIEHTLRRLLVLLGVPTLRAGRNGTMQVKNLNEILREASIQTALGEDIPLYLLTLLADQRGQNIRNVICHGFATLAHFNQRVADRLLHVLLTLSLIREKFGPEAQTSAV